MGVASTSEATQILHRRRIPNYAFPERVGSTLAAMWTRKQWLDEVATQSASERPDGIDREAARKALYRVREWGEVEEESHSISSTSPHSLTLSPGWLTPEQVDVLLSAYKYVRLAAASRRTSIVRWNWRTRLAIQSR